MINDFLESLRLGEQYDTHGGELFELFAFWTTLEIMKCQMGLVVGSLLT